MDNSDWELLRKLYKGFQRLEKPDYIAMQEAMRAYGAMVLTPDELIALVEEYANTKARHYSQG